jgi:hypothetical protein
MDPFAICVAHVVGTWIHIVATNGHSNVEISMLLDQNGSLGGNWTRRHGCGTVSIAKMDPTTNVLGKILLLVPWKEGTGRSGTWRVVSLVVGGHGVGAWETM